MLIAKKMLIRILVLSSILFLFAGKFVHADSDSYALVTGSADYQRLKYLNAAVNPYSLQFLKKYIKQGDNVLDLGCGPGILSASLSRIVGITGSVVGIDISKEQIKIAQRNVAKNKINNVKYIAKDINNISELSQKFDVVYIRFVLIHVRNPYEIIDKAKKVLKPGGYLLVEDVAGNDTIMSVPKDLRLDLVKKIDALQEEVQQTDFTIAETLAEHLDSNGFVVVDNQFVHPKLDTLPKRRNFSLGMRSLEKSLLKHNKISKKKLHFMIKQVEKMENNHKIDLYFYKIGQIAAKVV